MEERNLRKQRIGIVVSNKMDKSVVVAIRERKLDKLYGKVVTEPKSLWRTMKKISAESETACW